eukprot:TRINITY_DN13771_c0_g1_i1.p4 TRINITY_DN13771_c0_g1~~TRINITY_DN13771_c0_g1_i1.p4  ORF type:complete len:102 (-),score=32.83 TRINITY_DN13771_c0_g1_i1:537-842(-)
MFFFCFFFFFFKQKTAYEMLRSLVGSEMCIRDRCVFVRMCELLTSIIRAAIIILTIRAVGVAINVIPITATFLITIIIAVGVSVGIIAVLCESFLCCCLPQ